MLELTSDGEAGSCIPGRLAGLMGLHIAVNPANDVLRKQDGNLRYSSTVRLRERAGNQA